MQNEEQIELVEGDEAPPEENLIPTDVDQDRPNDPGMTEPKGLPEESFEADLQDDKGLGGACG